MTFTDALAKGLPMRRHAWQVSADPHPEWLWYVLDEDGDWLRYDQEDEESLGCVEYPVCKRVDFLATDWEVLLPKDRR